MKLRTKIRKKAFKLAEDKIQRARLKAREKAKKKQEEDLVESFKVKPRTDADLLAGAALMPPRDV